MRRKSHGLDDTCESLAPVGPDDPEGTGRGRSGHRLGTGRRRHETKDPTGIPDIRSRVGRESRPVDVDSVTQVHWLGYSSVLFQFLTKKIEKRVDRFRKPQKSVD